MQYSPQELKERLLKALDKDYNVVDMPMVLEVFSNLEKFPITRENLEQTRLGRYVNDLRRKTTDKDLAKRAKQLVRKWQKLLQAPNSNPSAQTVNGEGLASESAGAVLTKGPVAALLSSSSRPSSPCSRPGTPSSARSNISPVNNTRLQPGAGGILPNSRSETPPVPHKTTRHSPKFLASSSAGSSQPSSPSLAVHHGAGDQHSSKNLQGNIPPHVNTESTSSRPGTPTDPFSKTNVANMRKRRYLESSPPLSGHEPIKKQPGCDISSGGDGSPQTPSSGIKLKIKHERTVNGLVSHAEVKVEGIGSSHNGHGESGEAFSDATFSKPDLTGEEDCALPASKHKLSLSDQRYSDNVSSSNTPDKWGPVGNKTLERTFSSSSLTPKTPKVKTTAQLIKELHETGQVTLRATPTVTKIAMNQIEKEDDGDASVVPAGAKPRPRRKNISGIYPPIHSDKSLSQTKNERIESFLRTAVPPSPVPADNESDLTNLLKLKLEPDFSGDVESPSNSHDVTLRTSHKVNGSASFSEAENRAEMHGDVGRTPEPDCDKDMIKDPWSHLPPLDLDAIDWTEPASPPPATEVNELSLDRLHNENWPGVNGQFDSSGEWHDWTRCMSVTSYRGNTLHILPYVDIDG